MKKLLLTLLICLLTTATHAADAPANYYVPPQQFNAVLQVMEMGFANMFALFQNATGSFSFDEGSKSLSRLRIALDATSLMSNNADRQRGLVLLFNTQQNPEIRVGAPDSVTFTDGKAELKATLTLHGVSKPITLQAVLNHVGKSARAGGMWSKEGDAVGLSLRGTFKRTDFGISDDANAEGPARFGDEMMLTMEMQAIRQ